MSETIAPAPAGERPPLADRPFLPPDLLREALIESRGRWRDLVGMAADFAFELDHTGCFTFVAPAEVLGFTADELLGRPARLMRVDDGAPASDAFAATLPYRHRRAWFRHRNGAAVCMDVSAMPLTDAAGQICGLRGVAQDMSEREAWEAAAASALRRSHILDNILRQMRQEVLAPRMMQAVLDGLTRAVGAEGAAILDPLRATPVHAVLHSAGTGAEDAVPAVLALLQEGTVDLVASDIGPQPVLACPTHTRFGERAALGLWRRPGARPWDTDDRQIAASVTGIVRVVLEHEGIQREMARQARTDPLTGLLNRRAFLDEVGRRLSRLERESLPGTLLFIDLDHFKQLNDTCGHEVGDEALLLCASLLRAVVRPADLVARLGGDEFALWLDGSDELTAAERAEALRLNAPPEFAQLAPEGPVLSMSIGIACRRVGEAEDVDSLMRRADLVMYEVKRAGRGHWRVSHEAPAP